MAILSKACKPDNFESRNSLKVTFTNIWGLRLNFVDCESFLESNSPGILSLCETNLDNSIDSGNFSMRDYLPLIRKDSGTHMHGLAVCVKERFPFTWDLSLENSADSYLCFRLAILHSVYYFFFLYWSPSSSLCTVFDSVSSNIDEVLSINPSANVFLFGDFNVYYKDWLTYSGGTDGLGKLCYNFSISNDLTQMVNFPMRIPDCDSHMPALLDLFLSSDARICSTMGFPPLGNSDHVVVSVCIDFSSNSQCDALFHRIAYNCSCANWDGLGDHLRDIPWEDIFKLSVLLLLLGNFVSGLGLELMYISLIENINSSLIHRHGFQLLLLLPSLSVFFFNCIFKQTSLDYHNWVQYLDFSPDWKNPLAIIFLWMQNYWGAEFFLGGRACLFKVIFYYWETFSTISTISKVSLRA